MVIKIFVLAVTLLNLMWFETCEGGSRKERYRDLRACDDIINFTYKRKCFRLVRNALNQNLISTTEEIEDVYSSSYSDDTELIENFTNEPKTTTPQSSVEQNQSRSFGLQPSLYGQRTLSAPKQDKCPRCPIKEEIISANSPANIKSTSPWSYCINDNPNRIPRRMNFAMCSCTGCFNVYNGEFDEKLVSKNLTVQVPVMVRASSDLPFRDCSGKETCIETLINVPVGCYCHIPTPPVI